MVESRRTQDVRTGRAALRRIIGPITAVCVGTGVAIGSGIFAAPGIVARHIASPWMILLVWLFAGAMTLMQGFVTAELATRFPRAGGEYQFLKEAYGPFAAFFFGWSFTIFIVGGGAGTIAAALGGFAADLFDAEQDWAPALFGALAIVAVTIVNAVGLKAGAMTQNALTVLKTLALLGIAVGAWLLADRATPLPAPATTRSAEFGLGGAFLAAMLPAFWSYAGATDTAMLAEEIRDVRRSLPRALIGSVLLITVVYCLYNYALLTVLTPEEMIGHSSVPALVFNGLTGSGSAYVILLVSVLVCFGALSSTILSTVRVTFALARDGLTFSRLGRMSRRQAPVPSLIVVGFIACLFVVNRSFEQILRIYYLASAVLFGMSHVSLIVFRVRDRRAGRPFPATAYKAPAGVVMVVLLLLMELALAVNIVHSDIRNRTYDSLWTLAWLAGMALLYGVWKRLHPQAATKG